jgi:hypothetical protein
MAGPYRRFDRGGGDQSIRFDRDKTIAAYGAIATGDAEQCGCSYVAAPASTSVTLEQASELSGLSIGFLRRLVREKKLRGIRDRLVKVLRADVDALER